MATKASNHERTWTALLDGSRGARARETAREIGRSLRRAPVGSPDLATGAAGLAVLFAALDRAFPDEGFDDNADRRLASAIEAAEIASLGPSLYVGYSGIAWTIELLYGSADDPDEDPCSEADAELLRWASQHPWRDSHDLVVGLAGAGVYAIERAARGGACLARVVERLRASARVSDRGIHWHTAAALLPPHQRARYPEGYVDLGLAHGVPGVIAFLARAYAAGESSALALLAPAVRWLLAQELPQGGFPACVAPDESPVPARLAWCYGDPGVAAALWQAGIAANEPAWQDAALALARHAATRPRDASAVTDVGLCHGAAGLGHLFNRLWQATGDELLRDAAVRWLDEALDGVGADASCGLLDGSAGVALALLAAATEDEPVWDRMLLLSSPSSPAAPTTEVSFDGPPPDPTDPAPGDLIGDHRVVSRIGVGGMSLVFLVEHVETGARRALKIMHAVLARQPAAVELFLGEERFLRDLDHPSIVAIQESGETADGRPYFLMEFLEGRTLDREAARSGGRVAANDALTITAQIADAMAAAHARGILHRDLKPQNVILLARPGEPVAAKLIDFSLARSLRDPAPSDITSGGVVMATPEYASPEMAARRSGVDHRSDVYALGVMLFELVTGLHPFTGGADEVLARQVAQAPPAPSWIDPDVPAHVEAVILRCLAKDPAARFQSMLELADAIADAMARPLQRNSIDAPYRELPAARPAHFRRWPHRRLSFPSGGRPVVPGLRGVRGPDRDAGRRRPGR